MNPDKVQMIKNGINSNFWEWYIDEVLEPEYMVRQSGKIILERLLNIFFLILYI